MSKGKKDPGARAKANQKPGTSKQTRSVTARNTVKLTENSSISSAPANLTARASSSPPSPSPEQNVDRNPEDLVNLSDEEMDEAESSDYQQSSEGPSDSENGDGDYQPGEMTSNKRNQAKYGPSHNAGRPVTGAGRQKASSQKNGNQNAVSQNTASQRSASLRAASQNTASQSSFNQNDGQTDEEEIVLARDHPQDERCLPYRTTSRMSKRQIISWDANLYTLSLLSLIWLLEVKDYPIPWQELAAIVNPGATGEAFKQAMVKLRSRRAADGQRVPPARPGSNHPRHACHVELAEIMRNAGVTVAPFASALGAQEVEVVEDPSLAAAPVVGGPSVAESSAAAEKAKSEAGAQRSNGNSPHITTLQSQSSTRPESQATRHDNRDLTIIHPRSLTSAAPKKRDKSSLIFVADIGAHKALLNFNKKEQKLIFDVTQNLTNGRFAQSPSNPVFFLDQITAPSSGAEDPPSPFNSDNSELENDMPRVRARKQQKRKRDDASPGTSQPSPKLTGVVSTADSDIQAQPNKKLKRGPVKDTGEEAGGSKKRKHDDADMGNLSPGSADDWMFNPDYDIPAGESIPLGSIMNTDTNTWTNPTLQTPFLGPTTHHAGPYWQRNLNLTLSASPTLHPRDRTGGSLAKSTGTVNPLLTEDMGLNKGMDMGMPAVDFNHSNQMFFDQRMSDQQISWNKGFISPFNKSTGFFDPYLNDPFMGEGNGTLDYSPGVHIMGYSMNPHKSEYSSLGGIASDKDKDLLSSTSQWQSSNSVFEPSQAERRLSGLPPLFGEQGYGLDIQPLNPELDLEHHRHQTRGMLNDTCTEEEQFDPNGFANEAFARMDTVQFPETEDDGL
ncbi:hypothetical protein HDK77DRAFT_208018 [Phyllosticta capitalensis]